MFIEIVLFNNFHEPFSMAVAVRWVIICSYIWIFSLVKRGRIQDIGFLFLRKSQGLFHGDRILGTMFRYSSWLFIWNQFYYFNKTNYAIQNKNKTNISIYPFYTLAFRGL